MRVSSFVLLTIINVFMFMYGMASVDVFVGNQTIIDPDVYHLWLGGYSAHDAAHILHKRGILQQYGATLDMLLGDIKDHYRTYTMLERYLKTPNKLSEQLEFQISPDTQRRMSERYYEFDASVVREILGKKLSSRDRNSLDDISEKTRIPLKSCRRQFDNMKRVFKTVEEIKGSLVDNIQSYFGLSENLSRQYAAMVFITNNRFETTKKKLAYLTFADFVYCANQMIINWSYSSKDCKDHEDMDVDIDRDFLIGLREVKSLGDRDHQEEYKNVVLRTLHSKISSKAAADLENNFKNLSKTLVNIAYSLNHSKELRDLFLDLVEKFIEPCKQAGWTNSDVERFLAIYREVSTHLPFFRNHNQTLKVWERYLSTVSSCILQMYHS